STLITYKVRYVFQHLLRKLPTGARPSINHPLAVRCCSSRWEDWLTPLEKFAQLVDYHMAFETVAPHV
ncbi:hypothetical protein ACVSLB_27635, partial [Pseudomonas aeruginosa]